MDLDLEHPAILALLNNYLCIESKIKLRVCSKITNYYVYNKLCICNFNHHYNCNCNCIYCNSCISF